MRSGSTTGGSLILTIGDRERIAEISTGRTLREREWYFVGASFDAASRRAALFQEPLARYLPRMLGNE